MPDETRAKRDQPYVAHYDWSAIPGVEDPERLTPEQKAANEQHAADREALERGHTLRLLAAAPIVIASVVGATVIGLSLVVVVLWLLGGDDTVAGFEMTSGLVAVVALAVLLEVALIRAGTLLVRDSVGRRSWLVVSCLAGIVTVAIGVWAIVAGIGPGAEWIAIAGAAYAFVVGLWQWARSRRLADAARRLEDYSP